MQMHELDETYAAELLSRQQTLQKEARELIADLDLASMLARAGHAELIGSAATGTMVWRDMDFQVTAPGLTTDRAFATMRPLLVRTGVLDTYYSNERGQRYHFVLRYQSDAGHEWTMDVSFWLGGEPRKEGEQTELMARRLDKEKRLAILWIKDVWRHLPTYPAQVNGPDIYDAVLEHAVRTPDQFAQYLLQRGKPMR
jgi:hypothetical protein